MKMHHHADSREQKLMAKNGAMIPYAFSNFLLLPSLFYALTYGYYAGLTGQLEHSHVQSILA